MNGFIIGKDGTAAIKPEFIAQIFISTYIAGDRSGESEVVVVSNSDFKDYGTTLGTFKDGDKTTNLMEAKVYFSELVKELDDSFIVARDGEVAIKPEFISKIEIIKTYKGEMSVTVTNDYGMPLGFASFNTGDIEKDKEAAKAYFEELVAELNGGASL